MTNRKKYILAQDDDCHWYLIPADQKEEWNEWLDRVYVQEEEPPPALPIGAKEIDGWHNLTFENPVEE